MRNEYTRSLSNGVRTVEVPPDRDRLFHQVDRSRITSKDYRGQGAGLHLEVTYLPIQSALNPYNRQWMIIRWGEVR